MLQRKDLIYLPSFYNDVDSGRRSLVQLAGVRQTDSGLRCQRYQKHKYNRIERSATTLYSDLMASGILPLRAFQSVCQRVLWTFLLSLRGERMGKGYCEKKYPSK